MTSDYGNQQRQAGQFRPNLCFYHANGKGTGSAMKMNLRPAQGNVDGCIMLTMANQMTVGDRRGATPTFATFDWENAICIKLDFNDLTQILMVLRGASENISDGKGLYHRSARGATSIRLSHLVAPVAGYVLDLCRKTFDKGEEESRARILLNPAEALGVCEAISGSLYLVGFGIPMCLPPDAGAGRPAAKEVRHATAA